MGHHAAGPAVTALLWESFDFESDDDDAPAAPLCVVPPSAGPLHLFGDE